MPSIIGQRSGFTSKFSVGHGAKGKSDYGSQRNDTGQPAQAASAVHSATSVDSLPLPTSRWSKAPRTESSSACEVLNSTDPTARVFAPRSEGATSTAGKSRGDVPSPARRWTGGGGPSPSHWGTSSFSSTDDYSSRRGDPAFPPEPCDRLGNIRGQANAQRRGATSARVSSRDGRDEDFTNHRSRRMPALIPAGSSGSHDAQGVKKQGEESSSPRADDSFFGKTGLVEDDLTACSSSAVAQSPSSKVPPYVSLPRQTQPPPSSKVTINGSRLGTGSSFREHANETAARGVTTEEDSRSRKNSAATVRRTTDVRQQDNKNDGDRKAIGRQGSPKGTPAKRGPGHRDCSRQNGNEATGDDDDASSSRTWRKRRVTESQPLRHVIDQRALPSPHVAAAPRVATPACEIFRPRKKAAGRVDDAFFPDRRHDPFPPASSSGEAMLVSPRLETIIEDSDDPFDELWATQEANLVKAESAIQELVRKQLTVRESLARVHSRLLQNDSGLEVLADAEDLVTRTRSLFVQMNLEAGFPTDGAGAPQAVGTT